MQRQQQQQCSMKSQRRRLRLWHSVDTFTNLASGDVTGSLGSILCDRLFFGFFFFFAEFLYSSLG